jgi:thiamine biosynthesis lipoprotein
VGARDEIPLTPSSKREIQRWTIRRTWGNIWSAMDLKIQTLCRALLVSAIVAGCGSSDEGGTGEARLAPDTNTSAAQTTTQAPRQPDPPQVRIIHRTLGAMGTLFDIMLAVEEETDQTYEAIKAAFEEIKRVSDLMTTWEPESYLSKVNARAGAGAVRVPEELVDLVEESKTISKQTLGKFDISFAAMAGLWDFSSEDPKLPSKSEIKRRLGLVDFRAVVTDRKKSTIRLRKKGMQIGLGAVAKGYGIDRAGDVLKERGFSDFMIFGGGDSAAFGTQGGRPWQVGVQDPRNSSRKFASIDLHEGGAVVTSGDYNRFFVSDGKRYHDIIDPSTGYPAVGAVSATVLAKTAMRADAFATGVFVLGPIEGMEVIENDPELEGIIVDENFAVRVSAGLRSRAELLPIDSPKKGMP